MTSTRIPASAAALLLTAVAALPVGGAAAGAAPLVAAPPADDVPRVLFLTQSAGYQHATVKRSEPAVLSKAERALLDAAGDRLQIRATQDGSRFGPHTFSEVDAVVFYTTGDLPLDARTRVGLLRWVLGGGAFIGVHCATDTLSDYPPYVDMLGGVFDGHPWNQEVALVLEDPGHPAAMPFAGNPRVDDEIYQFHSFRRVPTHVLVSLDPASVDIEKGKRADGDYALAWCKPFGRGRVFYTALGHGPENWDDPRFLEHVLAGIEWAVDGPDVELPPPPGATVLFGDGAGEDAWAHRDGAPLAWKRLEDGSVQVGAGKGDAVTMEAFGDQLLHVEFRLPLDADGVEAGWGNSGVYIQGRYELQIIADVLAVHAKGECAAIYDQKSPDLPAGRRKGRWQSYDIRFRAPRLDGDGEVETPARVSVWHNGVRVHDDVELAGPTPGGLGDDEVERGPLLLQDHGDPVRYRNVWVAPLDEDG